MDFSTGAVRVTPDNNCAVQMNKTRSATTVSRKAISKGRRAVTKRPPVFPRRLSDMLDNAERDGYAHVISWNPDGLAFTIHDEGDAILPLLQKYFKQTRYKSFLRQLQLYGFDRIFKGPRKGECRHSWFVRGKCDEFHKRPIGDFKSVNTTAHTGPSIVTAAVPPMSTTTLPRSAEDDATPSWSVTKRCVSTTPTTLTDDVTTNKGREWEDNNTLPATNEMYLAPVRRVSSDKVNLAVSSAIVAQSQNHNMTEGSCSIDGSSAKRWECEDYHYCEEESADEFNETDQKFCYDNNGSDVMAEDDASSTSSEGFQYQFDGTFLEELIARDIRAEKKGTDAIPVMNKGFHQPWSKGDEALDDTKDVLDTIRLHPIDESKLRFYEQHFVYDQETQQDDLASLATATILSQS